MKQLTNRELSGRFNVDLAKWKRWSREFLPPDPRAGMQQGVPRVYSLEDAFTVYLGGYLIATVKLSAAESRKVISDLVPSFLENKLIFPMPKFREMPQGKTIFWDLTILRWKKAFVYQAKGTIDSKQADLDEAGITSLRESFGPFVVNPGLTGLYKDKYILELIGPIGAEFDPRKRVERGILPMTYLARRFLAYTK